jgi:GTP-binding protein Era
MTTPPPRCGTIAPVPRCGTIAVVGAPNAGKSTLVNALVGQKVAIVSAKVQTTRTRLIGIATEGAAQLLLVDTPGIFTNTHRRLDRAMVKAAWDGAQDADLIAMVIDAKTGLRQEPRAILQALSTRREPRLLILNKVDITAKPKLLTLAAEAHALCPFAETFFVAAHTGDGIAELKAALAARLPESPWHYPEDQLSDTTSRLMAAEITREQLYHQLHAELPYASTVETEKWEERRDGSVAIHQQILIERESQRAIILGKGGTRIKDIGSAARANITELLGRPVHLFLHVKVKEDWAEDRAVYRDSGLDWVD